MRLGILETTTERWLGRTGLVNSFLLLEFPGSSLASDIFLLKYPDEFLGSDL
jgi:hypothetical protein